MPTVLGIDCSGEGSNIGVERCIVNYGKKTGHIQVPKGTSYPVASAFDKDFWNNEVQQGRARFLGANFGVTTEVGDPTTETSTLQKQSVTDRPLPVVTADLRKGYEGHAGMYTMSGQDLYDVFDIYQNNIIKGALSLDGLSITGFSVGMYEVLTWEDATDGQSARTRIMYQYDDLFEYNTRGIALTNLNFNANKDIKNIVDIDMTGRADISEQKIFVKTPWLRNLNQSVSGFAAANFRITVSGVADPIVGTVTKNATTQEWEITPTATLSGSTPVVVYLTDATATPPVDVAKVGVANPSFYEGQTDVITPVA